MSDLRELYQEVILDHNKDPRNFKKLDQSTHQKEGYNPLCGDRLTLYLKVEEERIVDISFVGSGCAISKASASMMTAQIKGKTLQEASDLFTAFHDMLSSEKGTSYNKERIGKLAVFSGVCEYPTRVKCATLAWHTLNACTQGDDSGPVSTEE